MVNQGGYLRVYNQFCLLRILLFFIFNSFLKIKHKNMPMTFSIFRSAFTILQLWV